MNRDRQTWQRGLAAAALVVATTAGCGGGGGGGGGGNATVSGNVTNASTSERQSEKRTWLAFLGEEVIGLARRAYAAVDSSLGGITVRVSAGGDESDGVTGDNGDFDVSSPSGDVTVRFARGSCDASLSLPDVAEGSAIDLQNVTVNCNDANPGKVAETFQGVILNKPGSPNGNLNVCAFGGGGNHTRAVKTSGAEFVGTSFADLAVGDLIESTGERAGNGGNSTLFATSVRKVGTSSTGQCAGIATPTPEPTETPEGTVTPEATATSTPTATPTP